MVVSALDFSTQPSDICRNGNAYFSWSGGQAPYKIKDSSLLGSYSEQTSGTSVSIASSNLGPFSAQLTVTDSNGDSIQSKSFIIKSGSCDNSPSGGGSEDTSSSSTTTATTTSTTSAEPTSSDETTTSSTSSTTSQEATTTSSSSTSTTSTETSTSTSSQVTTTSSETTTTSQSASSSTSSSDSSTSTSSFSTSDPAQTTPAPQTGPSIVTRPPVTSVSTVSAKSTAEGANASTKSSISGGAIAGIVVGALAGVALLGFLAWFLARRRKPLDDDDPYEKLHDFSNMAPDFKSPGDRDWASTARPPAATAGYDGWRTSYNDYGDNVYPMIPEGGDNAYAGHAGYDANANAYSNGYVDHNGYPAPDNGYAAAGSAAFPAGSPAYGYGQNYTGDGMFASAAQHMYGADGSYAQPTEEAGYPSQGYSPPTYPQPTVQPYVETSQQESQATEYLAPSRSPAGVASTLNTHQQALSPDSFYPDPTPTAEIAGSFQRPTASS